MKTSQMISNISYNTDDYFAKTIFRLYNDGFIDWCYWIRHRADTDETKDHIHFVLKPSKSIDTVQLGSQFDEFDILNPGRPLGCTKKWNKVGTNNLDDWLLYAVHDPNYLKSKGQRRNYTYDTSCLQATDRDSLHADWNAINFVKFNRMHILEEAVAQHIPFALLVQDGVIPIAQRAAFEKQYEALIQLNYTSGSNRKISHEEP